MVYCHIPSCKCCTNKQTKLCHFPPMNPDYQKEKIQILLQSFSLFDN